MKKWMHKIEKAVDKIIPYLVALLLLEIILELFYNSIIMPYISWLNVFDEFVVLVFVLDLIFKYIRIRNIPSFFRKCWLDIIAVFPFFLLFRLFEELGYLINAWEKIGIMQPIFHEVAGLEKEAGEIIKESEQINKISRARIATRFFRPLARLPRLLKIIAYYEKPTGQHHPHEHRFKTSV